MKKIEKALSKLCFAGIKLNQNHRRDLIEWIDEIAGRDGFSPAEVLRDPKIADVLDDPRMNGPQKLKHVKKIVRCRRYPSEIGKEPKSAYQGKPPQVDASRSAPKKVIVDKTVAAQPLTKRLLERLSRTPVEYVDDAIAASAGRSGELLITGQKGRFLKKCPGTPAYRCCDYHVLNLGIGCFFNCHYCYLHHYMNTPFTIYANLDDMLVEVGEFCRGRPEKTVRLGSGEFIDSVGIDDIVDLNSMLVPALTGIENILFEIKTKSGKIDHILDLDHHGRAVVSWSVNSEEMIAWEEPGADLLADRLNAAAKCQEHGYKIGFHFDPLIHYEGWTTGYKRVVDMIFKAIDPNNIAWISLGALRFNPALKPIIKKKFPDSRLIYGELLPGRDGKLRYPLTLRREMFSGLLKMIRGYSDKVLVYLCMEDQASNWL